MSIRVVIADDHPVVRDGIRFVIQRDAGDITVVGEASNGQEVLDMAKTHTPDVYVLDITMPVLNGIETARRLTKADPKAAVIVLSIHDSRSFVEKSLEAGARGYLIKEVATRDLVDAIRQVHKGGCFLSPGVVKYIGHGPDKDRSSVREERGGLFETTPHDRVAAETTVPPAKPMLPLTQREREILQLLGEGASNKEIADRLGVSANTVHVHRTHIMDKLDIHKHADLVRYAVREGIAKL